MVDEAEIFLAEYVMQHSNRQQTIPKDAFDHLAIFLKASTVNVGHLIPNRLFVRASGNILSSQGWQNRGLIS